MNGKQGIEEMRTTAYNFKPSRWIASRIELAAAISCALRLSQSGEGLNTHMLTGSVEVYLQSEGDGG